MSVSNECELICLNERGVDADAESESRRRVKKQSGVKSGIRQVMLVGVALK